jgi:hypothetical protein
VTKVPLANRIERAGTRDLNKGQKIEYEVVADRRAGKSSADVLKPGEAREVLSPLIAGRRLARLRRGTRGRWHFPVPAILQWVSFTTRWS